MLFNRLNGPLSIFIGQVVVSEIKCSMKLNCTHTLGHKSHYLQFNEYYIQNRQY